jgi:hypothetical protein
MEELGIGRPSTYVIDPSRRACRSRLCAESTRSGLIPEDKGRLVIAFPRKLFQAAMSSIDFTANLEEAARPGVQRARSGLERRVARFLDATSQRPSPTLKNFASPNVLEALNDIAGDRMCSRPSEDGGDARSCTEVRHRPAVIEARQVRLLHRLLELPRVQVHAAHVTPGRGYGDGTRRRRGTGR